MIVVSLTSEESLILIVKKLYDLESTWKYASDMPLLVRTDFGYKNQTGNSLILEMTNMIKRGENQNIL